MIERLDEKVNESNFLQGWLKCIYLVCSFGFVDVWLRVMTRWINLYNIYEIAPNLFTLTHAVFLTVLVTIPSSKKIRRVIYGFIYFFYLIYAIVQYGAYLILGRFLFVSDFWFFGEGSDYTSYIVGFISLKMLLYIFALIIIGIIGIYLIPDRLIRELNKWKQIGIQCGIIGICLICISQVPKLYGSAKEKGTGWSDFLDPALEYQNFSNATFDMQLTGMYQYLVRDIQIQIERELKSKEQKEILNSEIKAFFENKAEHEENEMTGIFEGRNLIVVMMESMDDWIITENDTPTLYKMINNGINFNNMYTPQYSNGYTFNTEFAFNTSIYPYSNGNVAYMLARNTFSETIACKFVKEGYSVNSFHEGWSSFYNRGEMHNAFGYEKYHSYRDYIGEDDISVYIDTFLTENEDLYQKVIADEPFFSYIITYSGHLAYNDEDIIAQYALSKYPEYEVEENREIAILRAKEKITDDMFADLLEKLEEDGLLEETVIVAFADHYAYGIEDKEALEKVSEEAGSSILEKTPAFIYCAGYDTSVIVDKVMQITDLAPTVMNLFGIEAPKEIMGQDIFDDNYWGWAIFANNTWLTNETYVKNGKIVWNNGMTEDKIKEMNEYVKQIYQVNDAILECDYYAESK